MGDVDRQTYARTYLMAFWTSMPATMPIVVGSDAAHTPSLLSVTHHACSAKDARTS